MFGALIRLADVFVTLHTLQWRMCQCYQEDPWQDGR